MTRDAAFEERGRLAATASAKPRTEPPSPKDPHPVLMKHASGPLCIRVVRASTVAPERSPEMTRSTRTNRKRSVVAAAAASVLALMLVVGCTTPAQQPAADAEQPAAAATFPVSITDDAGRTVEIAARPERIVSLAPANTEMLFAIGAGERVVGVTSYDDYPEQVADIEKVGDFTGPNLEAVAAAEPDLVLVTGGVQADVISKLEQLGATVLSVDPQSLAMLYEDIAELGQATGESQAAEKVVADMKTAVAQVEQAVAGEEKVTAFVEIGQNPLYTVGTGTLIDEMITLAGGTNVVPEAGYVPYSTEQLVKTDPQVYMATLGSMSDPSALKERAGFESLQAVTNERVYVLDDNLVSRPGPRAVLGLKQIAEALHPAAFGQ